MLVLSRKIGEVITIGSNVEITVVSADRGVIRLGINAPKTVPVHRKEIYDKIIATNRKAAKTEVDALKKAITTSGVKAVINEQREASINFIRTGINPKSNEE